MALIAPLANEPAKPTLSHLWRRMIDPANQAVVETDLAAFFGPKSDIYLQHYRRMVKTGKPWALSWHWPFLLTGGFGWFFYRRAWSIAATLLVTIIAIAILRASGVHTLGADVMIVGFTLMAKTWYVRHGFHQIVHAEKQGLAGDVRRAFLQQKGGTSFLAGALAGPWFAFIFVVGIASVIATDADKRPSAMARSVSVPELRR
jgi:hypothetical protein